MKPEPAESAGQPSATARLRVSGARRLCFRALALSLPILALGLLEISLRLAGYGYPTSFFLRTNQDGESVLVENPKFGWRFFPHAIARAPQPLTFAAEKPAGTVRIFVLGESAALGDPAPAYGFGRQLQRLLQARHPSNRIEVINVAMTAINSHVLRDIAHDCASCQGDLWIVYAGNNEVVGPFGAGTVFGPQAPRLGLVRAALALKSTRIGQWLENLRPHSREPKQWEGMELFLHNQVRAADPALLTVYSSFSRNLAAVIRQGRRGGAKVVLATMAVNLKDCPPFASTHRPGLTVPELQKWQDFFEQGHRAESGHRYAEALASYQKAAQLDADFAELIFRRATCELALGQRAGAQADFSLARDLDTLRFRADSHLNQAVREAARTAGAPLVDVEEQSAMRARDHLPGDDQFYDHVHLNFAGNYLVASLLAPRVEQELFPASSPTPPLLPQSEIAHQLAFTAFDRRRVGEEMRERLRQPPFSAQSNFADRDRQWEQTLASEPSAPADSVWEYRAALALAPADWVLRENFGRLLEAANDGPGAAEQWAQVLAQLPREPEAYFHLANLAFDARAYAQAADRFRQALQRRPDSTESLNGLGLALAAQGQTNAALTQFQAALELNPDYSAARVNLALLLANSGDRAGAAAQYQTVLNKDTNNLAARINLAKLLSTQGKEAQAIELYAQAVSLHPDNAIAQFDLANALEASKRHEEALAHYAAAVRSDPSFADAQYNLALGLAREGRVTEALPHFAEAARLSPRSAELHFNYGVALAKLQQFDQAAEQFEQTLKLQPNHPSAQAMLERARQLSPNTRLGPVTN